MNTTHDECTLEQVGLCVYCKDHNVRLYQGQLPADKRPACSDHRWDEESGMGFYRRCTVCGEVSWYE